MSTPSEQSDSDSTSSSWILLDEGERDDVQEPINDLRETIEEIHDWDESDGVSIISEAEDVNSDSSLETTIKSELKEEVKEEPDKIEYKNEISEELILYPKNEVVLAPRKFVLSSSSLTSVAFMTIGLVLALYFHNGYEDEVVPDNTYKYTPINSKELIHEPILYQDNKADIEYIEAYNVKNEEKKLICGKDCNVKSFKPDKSNYKNKDKRSDYENKDRKLDYKNKQEKSNYKSKQKIHENGKKVYENLNEKNIKHKYYKTKDSLKHYTKDDSSESHEGYLMKKENYLKHKENKLKQKELKIIARNYKSDKHSNEKYNKHAKKNENNNQNKYLKNNGVNYKNGKFDETNSTWYFKMHKGRLNKRKDQQSSDWLFDRAKARNKNKNSWYFSWMEEREDIRLKKNFS